MTPGWRGCGPPKGRSLLPASAIEVTLNQQARLKPVHSPLAFQKLAPSAEESS